MTLEGKVKEIISNVLSTAPEHIRLEASLKDDLGATSLDRYTILMDIEDAFSLELDDVPEEELEDKIVTVADIVAFLKERVKE
jgi:acyl carrier protein